MKMRTPFYLACGSQTAGRRRNFAVPPALRMLQADSAHFVRGIRTIRRWTKTQRTPQRGVLCSLEAPPGIGPGMKVLQTSALPLGYGAIIIYGHISMSVNLIWSGLRGSNPPPRPWQGRALPNELNPRLIKGKWCLRSESNQRHEDFQSSALPTELQRHRKL